MRSELEDKLRGWGKWLFIIITCFSTIIVAPYVKFHEVEKNNTTQQVTIAAFTSSNSFLSGEVEGDKTSIQTLQEQIKDAKQDAATAALTDKTDLNEANRERDSALERLAIFEANPERWMQIYSNMIATVPAN